MKKSVISVIACLLFAPLFTTGVLADGKGEGKEVSTTVMSYNIHHGVGLDEQLSLQRIAEVIRDSGAEIVVLQEVDRFYGERSDFQDQAKELAGLLGITMLMVPILIWNLRKVRQITVSMEQPSSVSIRSFDPRMYC
ncbi:endonuclease/exonuclease/phosphatase family protein [Paenibacillus lautus]|uniref:endonuclease/exonuclease/phosphatase family protein n=1 Tax=Paenibacillus lautus TaxID=1401 RepID=UPI003D2A58AA